MTQVLVEAHDPSEALTIAHELRPELPRPRVALQCGDSALVPASHVNEERPRT